MKAKGFRVFAVLFILVGVAAGVITSLFVDALLTRVIVIALCINNMIIAANIHSALFSVASSLQLPTTKKSARESVLPWKRLKMQAFSILLKNPL